MTYVKHITHQGINHGYFWPLVSLLKLHKVSHSNFGWEAEIFEHFYIVDGFIQLFVI